MSHTGFLHYHLVWWRWIKNILVLIFTILFIYVLCKLEAAFWSWRYLIQLPTDIVSVVLHIPDNTHTYIKHTYAGPAIGGKHRHCCQTKGHTRSLPFQTQTAERGKITEWTCDRPSHKPKSCHLLMKKRNYKSSIDWIHV